MPFCKVCWKSYKYNDLHETEKVHRQPIRCHCVLCGQGFTSSQGKQRHYTNSECKPIGVRRYRCQHCDKDFAVHKVFQKHLQEGCYSGYPGLDPGARYCRSCDWVCDTATELKNHLATGHKEFYGPASWCAQCYCAFRNDDDLRQHNDFGIHGRTEDGFSPVPKPGPGKVLTFYSRQEILDYYDSGREDVRNPHGSSAEGTEESHQTANKNMYSSGTSLWDPISQPSGAPENCEVEGYLAIPQAFEALRVAHEIYPQKKGKFVNGRQPCILCGRKFKSIGGMKSHLEMKYHPPKTQPLGDKGKLPQRSPEVEAVPGNNSLESVGEGLRDMRLGDISGEVSMP